MKIGKLAKTLIALTWFLNWSLNVQAQSKKLIYEGARQGTQWAVYLINKELVQEIDLAGETRKLYLVDLEIANSYSGNSQPTNLIQCSTSEPFIAFQSDSGDQMATIDFINPGGEMFGYNTGTHWIYWAVCHDLWQPWEYDLKSQAIKLGYSTELENQQLEIPYGLLQNLKMN